jgi:hypothetical protein
MLYDAPVSGGTAAIEFQDRCLKPPGHPPSLEIGDEAGGLTAANFFEKYGYDDDVARMNWIGGHAAEFARFYMDYSEENEPQNSQRGKHIDGPSHSYVLSASRKRHRKVSDRRNSGFTHRRDVQSSGRHLQQI